MLGRSERNRHDWGCIFILAVVSAIAALASAPFYLPAFLALLAFLLHCFP